MHIGTVRIARVAPESRHWARFDHELLIAVKLVRIKHDRKILHPPRLMVCNACAEFMRRDHMTRLISVRQMHL